MKKYLYNYRKIYFKKKIKKLNKKIINIKIKNFSKEKQFGILFSLLFVAIFSYYLFFLNVFSIYLLILSLIMLCLTFFATSSFPSEQLVDTFSSPEYSWKRARRFHRSSDRIKKLWEQADHIDVNTGNKVTTNPTLKGRLHRF